MQFNWSALRAFSSNGIVPSPPPPLLSCHLHPLLPLRNHIRPDFIPGSTVLGLVTPDSRHCSVPGCRKVIENECALGQGGVMDALKRPSEKWRDAPNTLSAPAYNSEVGAAQGTRRCHPSMILFLFLCMTKGSGICHLDPQPASEPTLSAVPSAEGFDNTSTSPQRSLDTRR